MYKLAINFDEISDDLDESIKVMKECGIKYGELRTIAKRNFVFWSKKEIDEFKSKISTQNIEVIAAASPLFKWYEGNKQIDIMHDSYGFNPMLDYSQKTEIIDRTMKIVSKLKIPRLRIFSGLGKSDDPAKEFFNDPLFVYALKLANEYNIDLYLENEPVCKIFTKKHIIDLFGLTDSPSLKLWLDISNIDELGEVVDNDFLNNICNRIGYIHLKDYKLENGRKIYVPIGQGVINYEVILKKVLSLCKKDLIISIETHATKNRVQHTLESISGFKSIISNLGDNYVR